MTDLEGRVGVAYVESFENLTEKLGLNSLHNQEPLKHMIRDVF